MKTACVPLNRREAAVLTLALIEFKRRQRSPAGARPSEFATRLADLEQLTARLQATYDQLRSEDNA